MLMQMVQSRFQKQNQMLARQVIEDAAGKGLPVEPIVSKALEGMAKQAGEKQILIAMESVRNRYANALQLAGSLLDDPEKKAGLTTIIADSLAAGMAFKDVQQVITQLQIRMQDPANRKSSQENTLLVIETLQAARNMARLGGDSTQVTDTLCRALTDQYTGQQIKQMSLPTTSNADTRPSTGPGNAGSQNSGSSGNGSGSSGGSHSGGSGGKGAGRGK
jgi:hypothetical protein